MHSQQKTEPEFSFELTDPRDLAGFLRTHARYRVSVDRGVKVSEWYVDEGGEILQSHPTDPDLWTGRIVNLETLEEGRTLAVYDPNKGDFVALDWQAAQVDVYLTPED